MAVTAQAFLIRYPEFKDVNQVKIKMAIDDAALQVSARIWGNLYEQGVYALAAHLLYLGGGYEADGQADGQPARTVASESADGLSISYGSSNAGLSGEYGTYETTSYGQRYLELRALVRRHILVTR